MSFKTSHKTKKLPGRWHKKPVYGHRYSCKRGHVRIEKDKLPEPLPWCTSCHMTHGELNRYEYRKKTRIGEEKR